LSSSEELELLDELESFAESEVFDESDFFEEEPASEPLPPECVTSALKTVTAPVELALSPCLPFDCTYAPTFQYQPDPDNGSSAFFWSL
jgi:hypothetical protein